MSDLVRKANDALNRFEVRAHRSRLVSRPVELSIEATNRCNSKCPMCTNPVFRVADPDVVGDMRWAVFERTRPLWRFARSIALSGNGECFLNERYLDMAAELKGSGCFVHSFTNGLLLTPDIGERLVQLGFDRLGVSIGGATPITYRTIRGVDGFETVTVNLAALREMKAEHGSRKPEVHFNVAAMNSVLRELPALVRLAARLGVTAIDMFHLVVFYDEVRSESVWLDVDGARAKMAEALTVAGEVGVRLNLPTFEPREVFCRDPFNNFIVRWDGAVVSCSGHRFILGDVNIKSPQAIWNDSPWVQLRRDVWEKGYGVLCPSCHIWRANDSELLLNAPPNTGASTTDLRESTQ